MRTWWRKFRRILQAVRLEIRREDPDPADINCSYPATLPRPGTEVIGRVEGTNKSFIAERRRDAAIVRDRDTGARRSFVAVEAQSDRAGLVKTGREFELTLVAIKNSMRQLEQQGIRPDGIILEPHEFEIMLRQNFQWREGDELPASVTLFGLPVRVQR
jgi:hypothetical protein